MEVIRHEDNQLPAPVQFRLPILYGFKNNFSQFRVTELIQTPEFAIQGDKIFSILNPTRSIVL